MSKDSKLNKLVNTRTEYQIKLNEIFKKYAIRYFKRLSEEKSYKEFQICLLKIVDWSVDKRNKEFQKFCVYTKEQYDLSEEDISQMLGIIFGLHVKIMTSLFDDVEFTVPDIEIFWYKTLKRMAKYYFENKVKQPVQSKLDEAVEHVIQKYIPLKDIIKSTKKELDHYDYKNFVSENESVQSKKQPLNVTLESESEALQCIKSEDFENEYYKSEVKPVSEEKHIIIQKQNYNHKNYNYKNYNYKSIKRKS